MISLIGTVVSLAGGWITEWVSGKVEDQKAKTREREALTEARIGIAEKRVAAEIEWEVKAVDQLSTSWKDEYLTLILTVPLILVFVPGMEDIVANGFVNLDKLVPDWYIYLVGGVAASGLGLRKLSDLVSRFRK